MIEVICNYEGHNNGEPWKVFLELDSERNRVVLYDFRGNGMPMRIYMGYTVDLSGEHSLRSTVGDASSLIDYLRSEEAQDLMERICQGHEIEYPNGNPRGSLNEDARLALGEIAEEIAYIWSTCPDLVSPSEWFAGFDDDQFLYMCEGKTIEEAVEAEIASYDGEVCLCSWEVERYFQDRIQRIANQDPDRHLGNVNAARKILGQKPLMTLEDMMEEFPLEGLDWWRFQGTLEEHMAFSLDGFPWACPSREFDDLAGEYYPVMDNPVDWYAFLVNAIPADPGSLVEWESFVNN